ncbi:MAG TPA: TetR/AcrR family transcriptional regulator [Acidimicrobiia bacterium]|nr:TetR/AcrR family transcriptional regulator [Acidimicrobiia bacterium]
MAASKATGTAAATTVGTSKGDRTRRRLLDIAIHRFARDGYRRASVSDVAREADLTPAAVYAYFANKEALFKAAVDQDADELITEARAGIDESSVRASVPAVLATLVERIDLHPLAQRVLSGREPEVIDRLLELPSLLAFTREIEASIADAQRDGEVRSDIDPASIAVGLESIVLMLLMGTLQIREPVESRRVEGALAVLDAALRPPP